MLVHGFASDRFTNWRAPSWYSALNGAGYRVVALDLRGHGESGKPHEPPPTITASWRAMSSR